MKINLISRFHRVIMILGCVLFFADAAAANLVTERLQSVRAELRNFLNGGGDINAQVGGMWTPLTAAIEHDEYDTCQLYLGEGANPYARQSSGHSPLTLAAKRGNQNLCKLLLKRMLLQNSYDTFHNKKNRVKTILMVFKRLALAGMRNVVPQILCRDSDYITVLSKYHYFIPNASKPSCNYVHLLRECISKDISQETLTTIKSSQREAFPHCDSDELRSLLEADALEKNLDVIFTDEENNH